MTETGLALTGRKARGPRGASTEVTVLAWHLPSGGMLKVIFEEMKYLTTHGMAVEFLFPQDGVISYYGSRLNEVPHTAVPIPSIFATRDLDVGRSLGEGHRGALLRGLAVPYVCLGMLPAVFHRRKSVFICHELAASFGPALISLILPLRFIVILHDDPLRFSRESKPSGIFRKTAIWFGGVVCRIALRRASTLVATTSRIHRGLVSTDSIAHCEVVPLGDDVCPGLPPFSTRVGVLAVAKWDSRRRPEVYLEMIKRAKWPVPLHMVGHWESRKRKEEFLYRAAEMGLSRRVILSEDLSESELSRSFVRARVFVRFGFEESGTGQGVTEALGFGCPVILNTSIGGSDLIKEGVNGWIVEDNDLNRVAKLIDLLTENDSLGERMSEACLRTASAWTWQDYAKGLADIIRVLPG